MPTLIRTPSLTTYAVERLFWADTVRFMILSLRVRQLNRRMEAANQRVDRYGFDIAGTELALTMQRWLACHKAIGTLLDCPELPHVAQVRARLRPPRSSSRHSNSSD